MGKWRDGSIIKGPSGKKKRARETVWHWIWTPHLFSQLPLSCPYVWLYGRSIRIIVWLYSCESGNLKEGPDWALLLFFFNIDLAVPGLSYSIGLSSLKKWKWKWSCSVVSASVWSHWWQPTRLPRPWDSPGKNTGVGCHFLLQCMKVKSEIAQSCPTLCDLVDCSPPGSSVHGILQARILEWVAISFSRGSSQPRDWTQVSYIAGRRFNLWATREATQAPCIGSVES